MVKSLESRQYRSASLTTSGVGSAYYAFIDAFGDDPGGYGFYKLTPGKNSYSLAYSVSDDINGGGAVYYDTFHGTSWDYSLTGTYHEYTLPDWTPTANDGKKVYNAAFWGMSSAYDPVSGKVYVCSMDPDTYEYILATIDYSDLTSYKKIHTLNGVFAAMAFDKNGQLWAMSTGKLYKLDKTTGKETLVGDMGISTSNNWASAAFDYKTGKLYFLTSDNGGVSHMYEVNTTTGAATAVSNYSDNPIFPFFYIKAAPDDAAPADLLDLKYNFAGPSLTGQVTFTVPTVTYNGDKLSGTVTYTIKDNGKELKSGSAEAGAKVTENIETTEGEHVFTCVLTSNGKESNDNQQKVWVGNDQPAAVAEPALTIAKDGTVTLQWSAVTEGAHKGYIGTVTYTVEDQDGNVVAKDLSGTSWTGKLDATKPYTAHYYIVIPQNGDKQGEGTQSNVVNFGQPLTAPYASDFSTMKGALPYEIVDNDNDGVTWGYDGVNQSLDYISENTNWNTAANDWIVTPPFQLKADRQYVFSYSAKCYSESDREPLLTAIGTDDEADVSNYSVVGTAAGDTIHTIVFKPVSKTVTVAKDGVYRFAIKAMENTGLAVYVKDIKLSEGSLLAAPDSVTALKVVPGAVRLSSSMPLPNSCVTWASPLT